uniref:Uncharacterized protein n=1 Tax=Meloidogyne enterolobii TaxID=390850 RepID=A0A6V7US42_MELEN|nr:unnamed protein product [Meloidogyne enterolobii]
MVYVNSTQISLNIIINQDNVFIIELNNASKYINQLKQRSLIEIANNQIIQQFLPKLEKQVLVNNNFAKNANYYETSILDEVLDKNYNNVNSKKDIEIYKNKLLSSYWTEINLIGYKIELLENKKLNIRKN